MRIAQHLLSQRVVIFTKNPRVLASLAQREFHVNSNNNRDRKDELNLQKLQQQQQQQRNLASSSAAFTLSAASASPFLSPSTVRSLSTSTFSKKSLSTTTTSPAAAAVVSADAEDREAHHHQDAIQAAATSSDDDHHINATPVHPEREKVQNTGRPFLLDLGVPSLVPEWFRMLKKETFWTDVSAGITVGCIAVPLSLAIALASGVPAEVGLVTAAISGVAGGLLGGTTLAVTGPAAAISMLVAGAVHQHGLEALPFITLMCGGLQVASGVTRLGVAAKFVPVSVIAGFTTGVGTLILSGQVPKALALAVPAGLNPVEILAYTAEHLGAANPSAAALALGTSAAMMVLPKIHPKMPSALLAVGGATLATHTLGLDVPLIGAIPHGLSAFQFGVPSVNFLPSVDQLPSLCATTLLIYSMISVESLLSCAALEKMKKTPYKHNPDQELVGQGVANVASSFFMGMPVTSVIARSSLNVKLNAETRLPAIIQAGFVFSSVVFLSKQISVVPMPALSGVLITTGLFMLNPVEFKHCYAVQKSDAVPFAATVGGILSMGLAEGIGIGCVTAVALNGGSNMFAGLGGGQSSAAAAVPTKMLVQETHRVIVDGVAQDTGDSANTAAAYASSSSTVPQVCYDGDGQKFVLRTPEHKKSLVYKVKGPINFTSMFVIDNMIRQLETELYAEEEVTEKTASSHVVLDMDGVTNLEFTGVEELVNRLVEVAHHHDDAIEVSLVNCNEALWKALDQCDPGQIIHRYSKLSTRAATASS